MGKYKVFVIMPFQDDFFETYEMMKRHFEKEYYFSHAGEVDNQQNILSDIIQPIYEADVIIADLTGLNANVLYELGVAHALNKKTIIITKDDLNSLPFDLKQYRAKNYSTHYIKFSELIEYLEKNLSGAVNNEVVFSNPVKDFLDIKSIKTEDNFKNDKVHINFSSEENGFIDFMAEIEDNITTFTDEVNKMTEDFENMGNGINQCTQKIERVKLTGGASASFARKEAKKVATYMNTFDEKLKRYNDNYIELWDKIEKNTVGLIGNDIALSEDNIENLKSFLLSLFSIQQNIDESNEGVKSFQESLNNNIGIERELNQAIRFLNEDLSNYLNIMEKVKCSIKKIREKSKLIIGSTEE